jgi:two-component system alkaline phosphatase synthesis response regulator PhoP
MKNILLVEDDPFIIDIYASKFKKEGFLVDVAKDGQMALEKIKNHHPDLLVLDIILPKIDGWEVLKTLRKNESTKNIKVIVVSNLNQKDYQDNIANLNVIKYFLKIETTPEEITNAIKEILT